VILLPFVVFWKTVDIFLHCDILLNGSVAGECCFVVVSAQKDFHHFTHVAANVATVLM